MKRFLSILSASVLLGSAINSSAQDIHFSQFWENEILQNPALTGVFSGDYKYGVDYRNQWSTVAVPFTTVQLSGETRIIVNREIGDFISFGMVYVHDKAGTINFATDEIYPAIAYNKAMEDVHNTYISVGFTGGYISRSVDQSLMTTSNQWQNSAFSSTNSTGETAIYKSLGAYDLGAGVSLNSSFDQDSRFNYYLGASLYHINHPEESFVGDATTRLPMKGEFNGGIHFPFTDQFSFTARFNYSVQDPYQEFIFGGMFTWRPVPVGMPSIFAFSFGLLDRYQDALIPTFKFDYKNMALGFSFDITNSSLEAQAGGAGATEITLYVRGKYNHKKDPRDPIMCPRFEEDPNPNNTFR